MVWSGDPRLELRIGVKTERRSLRTARRYEVWRYCEDGSEQCIGAWKLIEFPQILHDIALMRAGAEGRAVDSVARIELANQAKEKANADAYRDAAGPIMDHGARLVHDRTQPKQTFRQVGGLRDETK